MLYLLSYGSVAPKGCKLFQIQNRDPAPLNLWYITIPLLNFYFFNQFRCERFRNFTISFCLRFCRNSFSFRFSLGPDPCLFGLNLCSLFVLLCFNKGYLFIFICLYFRSLCFNIGKFKLLLSSNSLRNGSTRIIFNYNLN